MAMVMAIHKVETNKETPSSGGGLPDSLDDHSGWGDDVDQGMKEVAEQRLKEDLKQIVDEINSSGKGWGSVGAETRSRSKTSSLQRSIGARFCDTSSRPHREPTNALQSVD